MNHDLDTVDRPIEPLLVAHVAEKIAQFRRVYALLHFELLELVAAERDDPLRIMVVEDGLDEALADRDRCSLFVIRCS